MSFLSLKFFVFFMVLLVVLYFVEARKHQHIVLLLGSYVFYALGDIRFLGLLFFVSVLMWFLGRRIEQTKKKKYLVLGVAADLAILGVFKYFNFFAGSFAQILGMQYNSLKIILPIGISVYIFQSISYIADIYTKKIKAQGLLETLLYLGFFPQIVSGPIVKAHDFFPQLEIAHYITSDRISRGIQRFALGMLKKIVIADRLGVCVDSVYSAPSAYSGLSLLIAVLSYALQIYYDFSGYSDMAIGVAYILGFDLGENFNLPYLAKNPSDFWRRWHISLSSWFRDYVYIPLGGNRNGKLRTHLNLFITMLLSGLWHGASWAFLLWGVLHAVASTVHKWFCDICGGRKQRVVSCLVLFTLRLTLLLLLFCGFHSEQMTFLKQYLFWSVYSHGAMVSIMYMCIP